MANEYVSIDAVKAHLNIKDEVDDAMLSADIIRASRAIDAMTHRRFFVVAGEARLFTPTHADQLTIGDCIAVTAVKTDDDGDRTFETTWDSTLDYYLDDGADGRGFTEGRPYWRILVDGVNGRYRFPRRLRSTQVTGSFGFCAVTSVPDLVTKACLLLVSRLYKRKDAVFGVLGGADWADPVRIGSRDPDVMLCLQDYMLEQVA